MHLRRSGLGAAVATSVLIAGCSCATGTKLPFASSSLPPCKTATATGCDRSKISGSGHGSNACVGNGPGVITASPIAVEDIAYIQPMGLMVSGHVTPIDHGYFYIKGAMASPPREAPVFSPLTGNVATVTRTVRSGSGQAASYDDYAITIEATCTFRVRFSNMLRFAGALGGAVGQLEGNQSKFPNLSVRAGDLIGYTGLPTAYGIDVWVENDNLTLTGFVNPAQYTAAEAWKTHVTDLFDNTQEPLKTQLLALDERDATPRWGKIDYDIDGKLVGNWFRVGTGGYAGLNHMHEGYWAGHLSVVYDGNDPEEVDVSIGDYNGQATQFAVAGSAPDPATVDETTGAVKYELGQFEWYSATTGLQWNHMAYMPHVRTRAGAVIGTLLIQLVGRRSLKIEIFTGKSAAQVSGFDSGSLLYER